MSEASCQGRTVTGARLPNPAENEWTERMKPPVSRDRFAALRQAMRDRDLDRALITSPEHVRYLSGFTGSSGWLMVGDDECVLITDFRYQEQAAREAGRCTLHLAKNGLPTTMRTLAHGWGAERVGYEGAHLTIREFRLLSGPCDDGEPSPGVEWSETERLVESLMVLKDESELASIRRAAERAGREDRPNEWYISSPRLARIDRNRAA